MFGAYIVGKSPLTEDRNAYHRGQSVPYMDQDASMSEEGFRSLRITTNNGFS